MTHWTSPAENPSARSIRGTATYTIVPSRITMKKAVPSSANASQRRGCVGAPVAPPVSVEVPG